MHRQVGAPIMQRSLELLDEQPLATHLGQGAIKNAVGSLSLGREHDIALGRDRERAIRDMVGLPKSKPAFASCDDKWPGGGIGQCSGHSLSILEKKPAASVPYPTRPFGGPLLR